QESLEREGMRADSVGQQVVKLGQNKRRQEKWYASLAEGCGRLGVLVLAAVNCGQQAARVEKDHFSPNPASSSSTFSARSGLPLLNSGSLGSAWRDCRRRSTPSRIRSASVRPAS